MQSDTQSPPPIDPTDSYCVSIYDWQGDCRTEDIFLKHVIEWKDHSGNKSDLLAVWLAQQSVRDEPEYPESEAVGEVFAEVKDTKGRNKPAATLMGSPVIPFRLYDCINGILKDQETYLQETNNVVPPYLVVSHVWGEIKERMHIPTIEWGVPISDKAKWDAILGHCQREGVQWLWMDIICMNQTKDSPEANREKAMEVPKMSSHFREATACLVIPDGYEVFSVAYKQVMGVYFAFANTGASILDNAVAIWNSMEMMNVVITDAWFSRLWTYQEFLLPKRHVLLDNQELDVDGIRRVVDWYHQILRNGSLKRPEGGKEYPFVKPDSELVIVGWSPEHMGYDLKEELKQRGCLDLVRVVDQTRRKKTAKDEDRLFALYGLISDDEKVPVEISPDSQDASGAHAAGEATLRLKWKQTMSKILTMGRVWPLLYNAIDPDDMVVGTNWMPKITTPRDHSRGIWSGPLAFDTIHATNQHAIQVSDSGLHIAVRKVGHVIGASVSIGDGGGELNKIIVCIWILMAKGYDIEPIVEQFKYGLAHADRDAVLPHEVEGSQIALEAALRAESLGECFKIFEKADLRKKLVYGDGVSGWNRQVLCLEVEGRSEPLVFLAWIHGSTQPVKGRCWVLDITSEPVESVKKWVIANRTAQNTFTKIGTMYARPIGVKDSFIRVKLD